MTLSTCSQLLTHRSKSEKLNCKPVLIFILTLLLSYATHVGDEDPTQMSKFRHVSPTLESSHILNKNLYKSSASEIQLFINTVAKHILMLFLYLKNSHLAEQLGNWIYLQNFGTEYTLAEEGTWVVILNKEKYIYFFLSDQNLKKQYSANPVVKLQSYSQKIGPEIFE